MAKKNNAATPEQSQEPDLPVPPRAAGRTPDYHLSCLHKPTEQRGKVGAAWTNNDGSIRIVIDPFVRLPPGHEIVLTLFKTEAGMTRAKTSPVHAPDDNF